MSFGLWAIWFKYYTTLTFRRKSGQSIHLKLLSFYKNEQIHSTTSIKKRHFMTESNWWTIIVYTCLLPHLVMLILDVLTWLVAYMDGIS
jgi:hypothetical protein